MQIHCAMRAHQSPLDSFSSTWHNRARSKEHVLWCDWISTERRRQVGCPLAGKFTSSLVVFLRRLVCGLIHWVSHHSAVRRVDVQASPFDSPRDPHVEKHRFVILKEGSQAFLDFISASFLCSAIRPPGLGYRYQPTRKNSSMWDRTKGRSQIHRKSIQTRTSKHSLIPK